MSEIKRLSKEIEAKLLVPMPPESITRHPTKTFLSTIKAIYIVERLNEVFGMGMWGLEHEIIEDSTEYVTVRGRIVLHEYGIATPYQYGGHTKTGKGTEAADGYKSAVTDCQSKCASYLGIGIDVFKGKQSHNTIQNYDPNTVPTSEPVKGLNSDNIPF